MDGTSRLLRTLHSDGGHTIKHWLQVPLASRYYSLPRHIIQIYPELFFVSNLLGSLHSSFLSSPVQVRRTQIRESIQMDTKPLWFLRRRKHHFAGTAAVIQPSFLPSFQPWSQALRPSLKGMGLLSLHVPIIILARVLLFSYVLSRTHSPEPYHPSFNCDSTRFRGVRSSKTSSAESRLRTWRTERSPSLSG
ncbi:hypothetical protein B0H12DRAFT_1106098 [Mycena haematopus]|nr:hypothetical protein B0H12DRAFT_1106098 [Mycena haematopus]